jgi:dipeptidyl aminopeptidase/acylaminoacyl peptidase
MNSDGLIDRLPTLLAELAGEVDGHVEEVFARTSRMRQRSPWAFGRPIAAVDLDGSRQQRLTLLVALLAVAALALVAVGAAILGAPPPAIKKPLGTPANGTVVIAANPKNVGAGRSGDIYRVEPGKPARLIIGTPGDGLAQECPAFSPDGNSLAYAEAKASGLVDTYRGVWPVQNRALVVVEIGKDGPASIPTVRFDLPAQAGEISCPKWSPDGVHLAARHESVLSVAEVASATVTDFPVNPGAWDQHDFDWSPDGSTVVVAEPGQLRFIPIDGGPTSTISVAGGIPGIHGWTKNGRIVYSNTSAQGDDQGINVVGADGTGYRQLAPTGTAATILDYYGIAVAPAGDRLVFNVVSRACDATGCTSDSGHYQTVGVDDGQTTDLGLAPGLGFDSAQWSPDGQQLLLASINGVFVLPMSSATIEPASVVTYSPTGELNLEWSAREVSWQPLYR